MSVVRGQRSVGMDAYFQPDLSGVAWRFLHPCDAMSHVMSAVAARGCEGVSMALKEKVS